LATVDSSFPAFVGFCQEPGYRFTIVSDGMTWMINHILNRHGIRGLTVYANQMHFGLDGVHLSFPWFDPQSPMRGVSKPTIVRRYQAEGDKVVFIGDGLTDLEAAGVADLLYARDQLLEHCRQQGIRVIGFSDFSDLLEKWVAP